MKIAIIGAGLAGLVLADRLNQDHKVTVIEKARGPGGRMSTRRAAPYAFDHGAQYFTAETEAFSAFLETQKRAGLIASWPESIELSGGAHVSSKRKWVAAPGMNAICKSLAQDVDVQSGVHVEKLERPASGWHLTDKTGAVHGPFDWVISTAPAPQTQALMPERFSGLAAMQKVRMSGCFALMLGFEQPLNLPWSALKSATPPVGFIALNSDKPDRTSDPSLLIQSSNEWAEAHLEDDPNAVTAALLEAASALTGLDLSSAPHQVLHRWRYAATPVPAGVDFLKDDEMALAACGDWCLGSKVEAAFLSATRLADALLRDAHGA